MCQGNLYSPKGEKIARVKKNSNELVFIGKTIGSNFTLLNRQIIPTLKKGFETAFSVCARTAQSDFSVSVGAPRIELGPHAPHARILPVNYAPCLNILTQFYLT